MKKLTKQKEYKMSGKVTIKESSYLYPRPPQSLCINSSAVSNPEMTQKIF